MRRWLGMKNGCITCNSMSIKDVWSEPDQLQIIHPLGNPSKSSSSPFLHLSASSFEKYSQCYQQPIFVYVGLFGRHPLRCVGEMRLQPTTSPWSLKNGTQIKSILPKSRSQDRQVILDFPIIAQVYFEAIFNPIQCSFGVCKYKLYGLLPFRFSIQQRSVTETMCPLRISCIY